MTARNYLQKRPFGNHDLAPAVGAIVYRLDSPPALVVIVWYAHPVERRVRPTDGAGEVSRLRAVDVLARAWVNQAREQFERIPIGKGHLVCNGLLDDTGDGCWAYRYTRRAMYMRVVAQSRGK